VRLLGALPGAPLRALGIEDLGPAVRRVVRVDLSVALLVTVFTCLTAPFTGVILRRDLGASELQLAILSSAGAAFMLLSLLWARAAEGRSPLTCVVWCGFLARALFLLVPLVTGAWPMVAILVASNLLTNAAGPANASLVERMYPREHRGRAMGLVRVAVGLPGIVLVLGAGRLLSAVDYRWVFPAAAVVGMLASLRLRHLPLPDAPAEEARAAAPGLADAWSALRHDRPFRRLLLSSFVFGSGIWLMMPAHPVLMTDVLRVTNAQVGIFAAVAAVAGMLGNGGWGRMADRWPARRALRAVYVVGALTPAIDYLARSPWLLVASAATESLMNTGLDLVWTLAVIDAGGRRRTAQYAAIGATLAGIRGVIGPLVSSVVIRTIGVHAVYLGALVLMLSALWFTRGPADADARAAPRLAGARRAVAG
jgi:predicted MFS family arabinose efflux permease